MPITGDHRLLKRMNRVVILRRVRQAPGESRADVAAATGLTKSTVSLLTQELLDEGWLMALDVDDGSSTSRGSGRPPTPLQLDPYRLALLGVDIGLGRIRAVATNLPGEVLAQQDAPWPAGSPADACAAAAGLVRDVCAHAAVRERAILGLGASVPGAVDDRTGVLRFAPNVGWRDVPLRRLLREALAGGPASGRPLYVQNDADVAALGEFEFGPQPAPQPLVFVMLGVGVGAGIVVNDQLLTGAGGLAGEIGHTILDAHGPRCSCGRHGCAEAYVGLNALRQATDPGPAGHHLGLLLQNLWAALDPALIVLGGPSCEFGEALLGPARHGLAQYARDAGLPAPALRTARFGALAQAVGAAATVLHYQLRPWLDAQVRQEAAAAPD